jgi:hypothetical protein
MAISINVSKTWRWRANDGINNYCDIFYQNICGLWAKYFEMYDIVHSSDFKIICLTKTWLSDLSFSQNSSPESYIVCHAKRVYNSNLCPGEACLM